MIFAAAIPSNPVPSPNPKHLHPAFVDKYRDPEIKCIDDNRRASNSDAPHVLWPRESPVQLGSNNLISCPSTVNVRVMSGRAVRPARKARLFDARDEIVSASEGVSQLSGLAIRRVSHGV